MKQLFSIAGAAALALFPTVAHAQDVAQLHRMFEAGRYKEVIGAAAADAPPPVLYMAGQSYEKLRNRDQARGFYLRLADRPETDPWHFVGLSARQILDGDIGNERDFVAAHERAMEWAQQAAKMAPDLMEAHYQLGLAYLASQAGYNEDAAQAFDRAAELNPAFAYAYYFAGQAYQLAHRPDRMTARFETFLKLAPNAPERTDVQQIMKRAGGL